MINDWFHGLYQKFAHTLAYDLTGGRMYRTQAPSGASQPYIVATLIGSNRLPMFSGDNIEQPIIQLSVFNKLRDGGMTRAGEIFHLLTRLYDNASLPMMGDEIIIVMRRLVTPREMNEDEVIHISADWRLETQSAGRP